MIRRRTKISFIKRIQEAFPKGSRGSLIAILILLVALPAAVYLVRSIVDYRSRAQVAPVSLYFTPSSQTLPPASTFRVMLNSGTTQVAFVRAVFTFDKSKVQLANEITTTTKLATVVQKTSRTDANATGRVVVVLGLAPADKAAAPTGIFEVANFSVGVQTTSVNQTDTLAFTTSDLQIVDINSNQLTVNVTNAALTLNPSGVTPSPADTIQINFQPSGAQVPSGYIVDSGSVYGSRNGQTYGWNADNSASTRDRNSANAPDQRYDTFIHLQDEGTFTWEIAVPNGAYTVFAVAGEPVFTDQINNLSFENVVVNDPDGEDRFDEYTVPVTVSDGKLTIKPAAGASNAKLAFLHITKTAVTSTPTTSPTATKTPTPTPTVTNTPTLTPTSTVTNTLTPTFTVTVTPTLTTTATVTPTTPGGATPTPIPGDINGDNVVNLLDYSILFAAFGTEPPSDVRADINKDGRVNLLDYSIMFANFGKSQ